MLILDTEKIIHYTQRTISGAKSYVMIISPFVQMDLVYCDLIRSASMRGTKVVLISGKKTLPKSEMEKYRYIRTLEFWFCYQLHAKCVINSDYAVLSSMNLYEASQTNLELGILLSKEHDADAFAKLEQECHQIMQRSEPYRLDYIKKR